MKILLLNDEFYTTGASTAMLRLAERLVHNHEVFVMPRIDGQGEIRKKFEELGIPIVHNSAAVDLVVAKEFKPGAAHRIVAADQIVNHANAIATFEQVINHVASDEAGAAGDDGTGSCHAALRTFIVRTLKYLVSSKLLGILPSLKALHRSRTASSTVCFG